MAIGLGGGDHLRVCPLNGSPCGIEAGRTLPRSIPCGAINRAESLEAYGIGPAPASHGMDGRRKGRTPVSRCRGVFELGSVAAEVAERSAGPVAVIHYQW